MGLLTGWSGDSGDVVGDGIIFGALIPGEPFFGIWI